MRGVAGRLRPRLRSATEILRGIALLAIAALPFVYFGRLAVPEREVSLGPARVYDAQTSQAALARVSLKRPAPFSTGPIPSVGGGRAAVYVPIVADLAEQPRPTTFEAMLVELLNADRAAFGLSPVEHDAPLLPIARRRATDQFSTLTLSHVDALGRIAFAGLLAEAQLPYQLAGENLARLADTQDAAQRAEIALMNSPTHRRNILEPLFERVAIGAENDGRGRVAIAQLFRTPP